MILIYTTLGIQGILQPSAAELMHFSIPFFHGQ